MDKEYEEIAVRSFVDKAYQDRLIFELFTTKKRKDGIGRLCHTWQKVLNKKYMIEIQKPNSHYVEIMELLKRNGADNSCYCISFCEEIDGKHLSLSVALERAVGLGMPSLIFCIPNKLAFFEGEQCYGPPPRYILRRC